MARPNPPEGSPLTSLANSPRVIKNSSALESVCSYGDMVRASNPFRDVKVGQENIVALDAVIQDNANTLAEKVLENVTFHENSGITRDSGDSDPSLDHSGPKAPPWWNPKRLTLDQHEENVNRRNLAHSVAESRVKVPPREKAQTWMNSEPRWHPTERLRN